MMFCSSHSQLCADMHVESPWAPHVLKADYKATEDSSAIQRRPCVNRR